VPIVPIELGTQSSPGRFPAAGNAQHINCFSEPAGNEYKSSNQVWGCAGFEDYATVSGAGGVRLLFEVDGALLVVAGRTVSRLVPGGTPVVIGGIATDGPVYAARNRRSPNVQVGIVSDGVYAVYDSGTLTNVSDPALSAPTSIDYLDGYLFFSERSGRISRSEEDNATLFDGLAFTTAESDPDNLVRVIRNERTLIAFGVKSTEFYNADPSIDPFAYDRTATMGTGCAAAGSIARVQQTIMWIADDKTVRRLNGYSGEKVSSYAVDRFIATIADLSQVSALTYTMGGNTFYAINSPEGTWEYNLATGFWHERKSYGLDRWQVSAVVEFDGKLICGDYDSPKLYEMRVDAYSEAGADLVMSVQTPPVHAFPYAASMSELFIDFVPGVGQREEGTPFTTIIPGTPGTGGTPIGMLLALTRGGTPGTPDIETVGFAVSNADVSDPELLFDWSDDGGINWKPTRYLKLGKLGETRKRIKTMRLGQTGSQGRVFRVRFSAAVVRGLIAMSANVERRSA
jgi:hypothetical protein